MKQEKIMRRIMFALAGLALSAGPVSAQTADEIIAKHIQTIGGREEMQKFKTVRRTGKITMGGGFEAVVVHENKRPNMVRQEFSMLGMTGVTAYDGQRGWKIQPWQGKKDPEPLGEEEMKAIREDADFDGPIVDYQRKGHKVEFIGLESVEGTDALKLKVTLKNGDTRYYYMDTDYYVPIKVEMKLMVRGAEREYETTLGDYKQVGGVYWPHSMETNVKGSPEKAKTTFEKVETNVPLEDSRFRAPGAPPLKDQPAMTED